MKLFKTAFQAIGTQWSITAQTDISATSWNQFQRRMHDRIEVFDKTYSRFRKDSLVTAMSKKAGVYELPKDGQKILEFYETMYQATNGLITPLIGQVVADVGYDAQYSFKYKRPVRPEAWHRVINYSGNRLVLKKPALLDFGAAGKGYLVDIVGQLCNAAGIKTFTINAGGDILHRDQTNTLLEIGLENPIDTSEVIGITRLTNKSLCASAGSRRAWGRYHHIINPYSLRSPLDILATWVMASDTMTADGIATALFFTDAHHLAKTFSFSYGILRSNMSLEYSDNFPVSVYEAER